MANLVARKPHSDLLVADGEVIHKRAGEAARTSWLLRDAKETDIRQFFKDIPLSEGMSQLASARKNIEIAANVLNDRIGEDASEEICTSCGGPPKPNGMWVMAGVDKDKETGLLMPYRFCSVMCVRERNRKNLLPAGSPKLRVDGREFGSVEGL